MSMASLPGFIKTGIGKAVQVARWLHQITEPHEDKNFMISKLDGETLRMNHSALRRVLVRPELKDKKFAIISIAGKMKTGKSFLMNYVLRYLRERGWENSDWIGDDDCDISADGFTFKGGKERCTTGIRIFGEIFEVPLSNGETIMVMLMDTQGLFDQETPIAVSKSLLTLTTLMSSVQIFNSKDNIDTNHMEYLKTCVEFALQTTKASQSSQDDGYLKLQNLMFLVRDYPDNGEETYGLEIGEEYLSDILYSDKGGEELNRIRSHIRESFYRVECFAMPHPGQQATKKNFEAKNKNVQKDFRTYVEKFVQHIISPDNLLPKQSSTGKAITSREMLNMIAACDEIFAKKMVGAQDMIKINQMGHFSALREEAVKEYDELMKNRINEKDGIKELEEKHGKCKEEAIQGLKKADLDAADDVKRAYLAYFYKTCDEHFVHTIKGYEIRKEKERIIDERTFSALKKYRKMMKRVLSEPVTDVALEEFHNTCKSNIWKAYGDSVDPDHLRNCVFGIYENFKEDNIRNRQKEQRQQASGRAKSMWDEFLATCQDESAMTPKRKEIEETILAEFLKPTELIATLQQEELLSVLNGRYDEAKRQNQLNLERKRRIGEQTDAVIAKYKTMFKEELSKPVTDEKFNELQEKYKKFVFEAYRGDVDVDEEALQHGMKQSSENLKRDNDRKRAQVVEETVESASNEAATMWDTFLNTYRDKFAMKMKKKTIQKDVSEKFLNPRIPEPKPTQEKLLSVLEDQYKKAKMQNKENWISATKEADNVVDESILAIVEDFDEIMVDRYLEEEVIKVVFNACKTNAKYKGESKDVKKYFHEKFEEQCNTTMHVVLKKNDSNKKFVVVRVMKSFLRRIAEFLFRRRKPDVFSLFHRMEKLEIFRHLHQTDDDDMTAVPLYSFLTF